MRERRAEIWTRLGVQPMKMGNLYVTDTDCRFTYDLEYLNTGLPGLGLVYAPEYFGDTTIKRTRTPNFDFLPPIQALIPPHSEENFTRRLLLQALHKKGLSMPTPFDQDWEILMYAGHGGIGHIDVFPDDEKAHLWYSSPSTKLHAIANTDFGFSLKEFLTWFDNDAEHLLSIIGPTPTVGGGVPKLLLAIPQAGWDGQIGLPTRYGDTQNTDVVLKLEKASFYPGITELEALGLDIHKAAGMDVPRYWRVDLAGVPGIAIERFDRDNQRAPLFMESFYSVLACADESISSHYDATYDRLARAIHSPDIQIVDDRRAAAEHLFQRLLLAMLTGNGDLHLMNLSLLRTQDTTAFSPVYDPTPMRAFSKHNELLPQGMTFGDYGDYIDDQDDPVGFEQAIWRFVKELGTQKVKGHSLIEKALADTSDFVDRVDALQTVPDVNKTALIQHHHYVTRVLKTVIGSS